jgi:hypothetical protein
LKQFIIEIEDNQRDDFIVQFFEEMIIDIDISIDNISITDFIIKELDSESKTYFIAVDSIDNIGKSGSSRTTPGRHGRECPPVRADPRWSAPVPS